MNAADRQQAEMLRDYLDDQRTRDPELRHILALADRALGESNPDFDVPPNQMPRGFKDDDDSDELAA